MAIGETILTSFFAVRIVYPFLLVFTLVFAILQKTKILGDDENRINALIALSMALIVVAFSWSTDIIINLMPFLAVSLVVILMFMLLFGFVASIGDEDGFKLKKNVKMAFLILITFVIVISVLITTGFWDRVYFELFVNYASSGWISNVVLLLIVAAALFAVIKKPGTNNSGESNWI